MLPGQVGVDAERKGPAPPTPLQASQTASRADKPWPDQLLREWLRFELFHRGGSGLSCEALTPRGVSQHTPKESEKDSSAGGIAFYDLVLPQTGETSKYTSDSDAWWLIPLALQIYFALYSDLKASYILSILCMYNSHSWLVLNNVSNSLMTAILLSWHSLCSRATALGGAAVRC